MKMQRAWFLIGLVAAVGCRSRNSVCDDAGCVEALNEAGGQAGAGGVQGDAGAGAGGREADGAGGDGTSGAANSAGESGNGTGGATAGSAGESAEAGAGGETGTACGECAPDLHCVEHAGGVASCEYPNPGRWLVFTGNDTGDAQRADLRALRLEGTEPSASVRLTEGASGEYFKGLNWSPDGRHMIAVAGTFDDLSTNSLFHVEFGTGLPSRQARLPGLPVSGASLTEPDWAPDSSRFLVRNERSTPELYLVRFASEGIHTELLFREGETYDTDFCSNPRWFVRNLITETIEFEARLVDSENPTEERDLWPGSASTSRDGHFLIGSDYDTGVWRATCEAGTETVRVSDRSAAGFAWSKDSRLVVVPYDDGEIVVLDSSNDFGTVFSAYPSIAGWALTHRVSAQGSRLVVFGGSEPGADCNVLDVDLTTTPLQVRDRGSCPDNDFAAGGDWGVLENGTIWMLLADPEDGQSLWLLEEGADSWRPIIAGLSYTEPHFTPDGKFVVLVNEPIDGATETLAFSLLDPEPTAMPLLPAPAPHVEFGDFYAGGVLLNGGNSIETTYRPQIWWTSFGSSGFGAVVPLADVAYAVSPLLQPEP